MNHTVEELKELLAAKLTIEEIMDILGWNIGDLLEAIEEEIITLQEDFEEAVR